jgi:hypothetical protein
MTFFGILFQSCIYYKDSRKQNQMHFCNLIQSDFFVSLDGVHRDRPYRCGQNLPAGMPIGIYYCNFVINSNKITRFFSSGKKESLER